MPETKLRDPNVIHRELLEANNLVIMPLRPKVTITESGGAIIEPQFSVTFKTPV